MRCIVLVNSKAPGIGDGLTYESGGLGVVPGMLVMVPLRKKSIEGIVLSVEQTPADETYEVKNIERIVSEIPLLSEAHLRTMQWMAGNYECSLRSCLTSFLPPPPWKTLTPRETVGYRIGRPLEKGGTKQMLVMDCVLQHMWIAKVDLREETGASAETIRTLVESGHLVEEKRVEVTTHPEVRMDGSLSVTLSAVQEQAMQAIRADPRPSLLFGITGSGKTEVYAALIAEAALRGKQTIVLVPEILLTEHTIHRFEQLFKREQIAVLHSRLTPLSRRQEWQRIQRGEALIVIGSRSALFAPFMRLGLIVIDEEHEWTYKNEQTPRYHARETAEQLCKESSAKLVLGTATPSIESWDRVKKGRYHLARLPERYQNRALPTVRVVDLGQVKFGDYYPFSPPLIEAIAERLKKREQSVLFLNRRGIATAVLCLGCRRRLMSPVSQLPYTVHRTREGRPYLLDHFSGQSADIPVTCPHCKSYDLMPVGAGTQKIEDLIKTLFPDARWLRADSDTLTHPEQMRTLLQTMREGNADILLGTQSVVKGLDLPGVTLAAVLLADIGLSLPHFRAGERVWQLLTQLTGRSGRAKPGEVIIQTFRPGATEIVAASEHRTEDYLEAELQLRETLQYPPVTEMIRFIVQTMHPEARARALHAELTREIATHHITAQATVAPTLFGAGQVWHVLLRGKELRTLLPHLSLEDVTVDIDPIDCI